MPSRSGLSTRDATGAAAFIAWCTEFEGRFGTTLIGLLLNFDVGTFLEDDIEDFVECGIAVECAV